MHRIGRIFSFSCLSVMFLATPAWGVQIDLKNGEKMAGKLFHEDDTTIYIENEKGLISVSKKNILRMDGKSYQANAAARSAAGPYVAPASSNVDIDIPLNRVRSAYQSIPHQQTTFDPTSSGIKGAEAQQLNKIFMMVDVAVVGRVETLEWFRSEGQRGTSFKHYQEIINNLLKHMHKTKTSRALKKPKKLVYDAIREQRQYFKEWYAAESRGKEFSYDANGPNWQRHAKVQSAHKKLTAAYQELMRAYPQEISHNKQAFFDHLCALDFI